MRNLKKVLSLVLCVAMMLSVMVVGAGAAFSDQSAIKNTEAVDACTALNIIGGYPDGSFKPEGNITRAEVTKMICVALNGGKEPAVSTNTTPTFSDVRGTSAAWAEGYIESCAAQGIVSGVGAGKFAPAGNVTGVQLAKMLLVALGYNSDNEGFTGNAWATNVNVRAAQKGLYSGLETMDTNAAISRDNAAQMVWNALNAYEVEYKTTLVTDKNGQLTSQITVQDKVVGSTNDKITLMEDKYEADTFVGTFDGNADSLGLDDGMIQVYGVTGVESKDNQKKEATFKYDLDLKYVGEEVKVLYKDETEGTAGQPDKKDTIYGVYVTGETKVINTTRDGIDDTADGKKVKIDGTKYECAPLEKGDVYAVNNLGAAANSTVDANHADDAADTAALFAGLSSQSGSPVKFVCNSNGKIVKAYVMDSTINKVNAATSSKVTLNTIGGLEKEDNYIYDNAAKDDIVVATKQFDDVKYTVAKAETISGELEGFVTESNKTTKVTISGKTYKVADKSLKDLSDDCVTKVEDSDIGSEVVAYMLNGMVGALEVKESSSTWAVVSDNNDKDGLETSFNAMEVELITSDGKTISGKVHKDSESAKGTKITKDDIDKGTLVKYVQTSENVIKIKEVSTGTYTAAEKAKIYDKDTKSLFTSATASTVVASDATAYVTNSDGDIKTFKLRDLKSITAKAETTVNYVVDDGKIIAAYINLNSRPTGSAADTVYGEITAVNGTKKVDGDYYTEYVVTCNDKPYTVYTNQTDLNKKDLVSFDPTSDNIYDKGDIVVYRGEMATTKAKAVWVKEYDAAETLTYYTKVEKQDNVFVGKDDTATTDAVDDDVIVAYVDLDDVDNAGENIGVNEFSATTGYKNAIVVYDTDGKTIIAIFVETSDDVDMSTIVTNS